MAEENNSGGGGNWLGGALGAAGGLLGMIGQNSRAKKQHNRQKELMGIQFQNQQQLNQQGHELQKKMWEDTNYPRTNENDARSGIKSRLNVWNEWRRSNNNRKSRRRKCSKWKRSSPNGHRRSITSGNDESTNKKARSRNRINENAKREQKAKEREK